MAKKRKTRRQKIIAATRRNFLESALEISSSGPALTPVKQPVFTPAVPDHSDPDLKIYTYVLQDARKTLLTIAVIAALNIVLFLILKVRYMSFFDLKF